METEFNVDIDDESFTIYYRGWEVVHWVVDEWSDPTCVTAMLNALNMVYTDPTRLLEIAGFVEDGD